MTQLRTEDAAERAQLAAEYARIALREAERYGATSAEMLQLCDEVIARRLLVHAYRIRQGWRPPRNVRAQMSRDRALVHIAAGATACP